MKIPTTIKRAATIAAVCLAAHTASAQNMIGVNFVANDNTGPIPEMPAGGIINTDLDSLLPTDIAGVFPQANWNNLGRFGDSITLNDNNGVSSGVSIAWMALGMWHNAGYGSFPQPPTTPDYKLMDGFLESTWSFTGPNGPIPPGTAVTNIANCAPIVFLSGLQQFVANQCGGPYSIIIYCNSDIVGGQHSEYWIDAVYGPSSGITVGAPITPPIYRIGDALFAGTFTQVCPSATNDTLACSGNYIEFDGLTNDEILIVSQNMSGSPSAEINGIQIIALGVRLPPQLPVPIISPTNVIFLGTPVTISDPVYVCGTVSYQWQTDGGGGGSLTNIPGATNSSVITTPTTAGTWNYDVVVTNNYGSVTSVVATVTVLQASAPIVTRDTGTADFGPITNLFAFVGGNVNFYAAFDGTPPITNQWLFNSGPGYAPIAGAANNSWTVTNVQSSSAGNYELAATNAVGRSNSTPAHLTALADPAAPSGGGVTNLYSYCVYTNQGLWAYWKFEETNDTLTSSMQAYDYSGHNFDATYGNSDGTVGSGCLDGGENIDFNAQYGPNPNDYLNGYPGLPANNKCAGLSYGYNNGYLKVPPLNLNTNTVTVTMWIYPNDPWPIIAPNTGLLMNRNGADAAGVGFSGNQNANLTAALGYTWNNNNPATYGWNSHLFPPAQTWSFVAYVISPQNITIYLCYVGGGATNMVKAVNNITNAPEAFSGGTTWIGGDNWDNNRTFNGCIDEVAVFTNAMSENQIVDLFLKALGGLVPPPPGPLVGPTNTTLFMGQTLQLTAIAGGIPAPNYQWQVTNGITWANLAGNPPIGLGPTTNSTLYWTNFTGQFNSFRCIATNYYGRATSSVAFVSLLPVANWNKGLWTVNFAITPNGPGSAYAGRGVLGTTNSMAVTNQYAYWNALSGSQFANIPPSLRDDGITVSGVNFGSTNFFFGGATSFGENHALLDTFCSFDTNGAAFVFTNVPNGKYNLALYGIDGAHADRSTIFTVNGASQSIINAQDINFLPDNTVLFTNLLISRGSLEVDMVPLSVISHQGAFNGAQLELIQYGPQPPKINCANGICVLSWEGGGLLEATNVLGPWRTNTAVSPLVITATNAAKFYRVFNNNWP